MEGFLEKKTSRGKWRTRYFKVENHEISWLKSDQKTTLSLTLSVNDTEVRDVKFGLRKFMFEVETEGRTLVLAAAGEMEKAQWILVIEKQAGIRQEKLRKTIAAGGALPKRIVSEKIAGLANVLGLNPALAGGGGGSGQTQMNDKLKEKLAGTALPMFGAPSRCYMCGEKVYKVEELVIGGKTMHRLCFRCAHCHRELTMANHAYSEKYDSFYCNVHYVELFGSATDIANLSLTDDPSRSTDSGDAADIANETPGTHMSSTPLKTFADEVLSQRENKFSGRFQKEVVVEAIADETAREPLVRRAVTANFVEQPRDQPLQQVGGQSLDNSAALSKPLIKSHRNAPTRRTIGKMLPPEVIKDRTTHENSFCLEFGHGKRRFKLFIHASSLYERNKWVACLVNAIFAEGLKNDLLQAQKTDMRAAIQAQLALDSFVQGHETAYQGYLQKLSIKSKKNWKKRYFVLKDGKLAYFENENSKNERSHIDLSRTSIVKDCKGKNVEHELAIAPNFASVSAPAPTPAPVPASIPVKVPASAIPAPAPVPVSSSHTSTKAKPVPEDTKVNKIDSIASKNSSPMIASATSGVGASPVPTPAKTTPASTSVNLPSSLPKPVTHTVEDHSSPSAPLKSASRNDARETSGASAKSDDASSSEPDVEATKHISNSTARSGKIQIQIGNATGAMLANQFDPAGIYVNKAFVEGAKNRRR